MFTYSEMIVGLWLVPVALCILAPLAMLCVWSCMQFVKKISGSIGLIARSPQKEGQGDYLVEGLQSQLT